MPASVADGMSKVGSHCFWDMWCAGFFSCLCGMYKPVASSVDVPVNEMSLSFNQSSSPCQLEGASPLLFLCMPKDTWALALDILPPVSAISHAILQGKRLIPLRLPLPLTQSFCSFAEAENVGILWIRAFCSSRARWHNWVRGLWIRRSLDATDLG
jgi:hypothetical protein